MFKKVGIIALACSILVSGAAFAETKEVNEVVDQTDYSISFDDEIEWLEDLNVSSVDMAKLEVLYKEAIALEENGKEDEAEAKWNEFDAILDNYFEEDEITFEEEKEWLEEMGVSKVDTTTLATLFNELITFEENGQEKEAEAKWNEIDAILDNYYNEEVYTFEEELEWLNEMGVSEADIAALETLFNEAIVLEENDQEKEAEAKWNEFDAILDNYYNEEESDFTFEEEKEWLEEIGVNSADMVKLEALFNEVIALEENDKEEEAEAKWNEIDTILENYYDSEESDEEESDFTFEDEKEWLKEIGINSADMVKLEALFNEVIALEENDKEEEAEAKWNEIDTILENYYDSEESDEEEFDDEDYDDEDYDDEDYNDEDYDDEMN
jgi:hypothetical protein